MTGKQWLRNNAVALVLIGFLAPITAGSLFLFERYKNPLDELEQETEVSTDIAVTGQAALGPVEAGVITPQDASAELGMSVPDDTWALFVWLPIEVTGESFTCPVQRLHEVSTGRVFQPAGSELDWSSSGDSWCSGTDTTLEVIFLIPGDSDGIYHLEVGEQESADRALLLVDVSPEDSD